MTGCATLSARVRRRAPFPEAFLGRFLGAFLTIASRSAVFPRDTAVSRVVDLPRSPRHTKADHR